MINKVIVLLSTYNGEKYLKEQLESLFLQKDVDVSVIVRDDGSSDGTCQILDTYKDKFSLEWYKGKHCGVQKSFMELMKMASSKDFDYFAFCDQDDVWDEDKLRVGLRKVRKCEARWKSDIPVLYYSGQRLVDKNLNLIGNHTLKRHRTDYARFLVNDAAGCTEVFNRNLLDVVNRYEPRYILSHDTWILKVCLAVGGKIIVDPEVHLSYRQHDNNTVGVKRDIISKIRKAKNYISGQNISKQMSELKKGYSDRIVSDYMEIIDDVSSYKNSFSTKKRLLSFRRFYFEDIGLQMVYALNVLFNKV